MALEKHQEPIQMTLWIASMQNGTRKNNWQPLKLKWDYKYDYPRCCHWSTRLLTIVIIMLLIDYSKILLRNFHGFDMVKAQTFRNYASINLMSMEGKEKGFERFKIAYFLVLFFVKVFPSLLFYLFIITT